MQIGSGSFIRRPYPSNLTTTGVEMVAHSWQKLELIGIFYKDGLLVLHEAQNLKKEDVKDA